MRPINLLPPEVAQERNRRRKGYALIALGVVYVALLVGGIFVWSGRVAAAERSLDTQVEANRALERKVASLADAGLLVTEYEEKATLVRSALAVDVDWGIILNDLARLVPPCIWVNTFSGVGFDFPDVSEWLRTLNSSQFAGIGGTWVSTISAGAQGEQDVVNFTSTAALTSAAVTNRADLLIPEVP